jgi:hypothetical protein
MNAASDETSDAPAPDTTRLGMSFNVAPLGDISGNLPRLLGESILELLGMFYPSAVGKKANVVVTELVQNVLENIVDPHSELHLDLRVDGDALIVRVTNKATPEQFEDVRARVDALTRTNRRQEAVLDHPPGPPRRPPQGRPRPHAPGLREPVPPGGELRGRAVDDAGGVPPAR